ncbi:MAG TPA: sigma-70 family RNA polymerase sigma factor [Acidimicrobiia bacterium]|nr:sigma-70 family RNA polymerase sigma factor [Acidimicrobiia bacterium]
MSASDDRGLTDETFPSALVAAQAGAGWAWNALMAEMGDALHAYVRRQGARDADDLVGETWLHVARGIGSFDGSYTQFRSWVFMVAHHRIIDERRRTRRKPSHPADTRTLEVVASAEPSAESEAIEALGEEEVVRILATLPEAQREVMLLRIVAGFGITEIAEIVGKRPGAVQALQHRAVNRLRGAVERSGWN